MQTKPCMIQTCCVWSTYDDKQQDFSSNLRACLTIRTTPCKWTWLWPRATSRAISPILGTDQGHGYGPMAGGILGSYSCASSPTFKVYVLTESAQNWHEATVDASSPANWWLSTYGMLIQTSSGMRKSTAFHYFLDHVLEPFGWQSREALYHL